MQTYLLLLFPNSCTCLKREKHENKKVTIIHLIILIFYSPFYGLLFFKKCLLICSSAELSLLKRVCRVCSPSSFAALWIVALSGFLYRPCQYVLFCAESWELMYMEKLICSSVLPVASTLKTYRNSCTFPFQTMRSGRALVEP